jgi:hypothetical protein
MIRDAHWYALAAGERSSEGIVTWYRAQHVRSCEGNKGTFGHNSREGSDLRWHGRAKASILLLIVSAGPAIYRTIVWDVNGRRRGDRAFFHKVARCAQPKHFTEFMSSRIHHCYFQGMSDSAE